MHGQDSTVFAFRKERLKKRLRESAPPVRALDEQVVDKSIDSAELHAVSKGQYNVSDGQIVIEGDPH